TGAEKVTRIFSLSNWACAFGVRTTKQTMARAARVNLRNVIMIYLLSKKLLAFRGCVALRFHGSGGFRAGGSLNARCNVLRLLVPVMDRDVFPTGNLADLLRVGGDSYIQVFVFLDTHDHRLIRHRDY